MAKAETYKHDDVMSFPQMAVEANSLSFLCELILILKYESGKDNHNFFNL
jgi:hypothetical protein